MEQSFSKVSSLNSQRIFSRSQQSSRNSRKPTRNSTQKYIKELTKYLKELSHLESRIQHRSILLNSNYSEISKISSSKDPQMLQKILKLKLTMLVDRKDRLLEEISTIKSCLESQKIELQESLRSSSSRQYSIYSSSSEQMSLSSIQNSLNHKLLDHYSKYNETLSEIESLVLDGSISKEDRKIIFSILFPVHSDDKSPILTSLFRKLFGSRVATASQFIKDLARRSSSSEIHLSSSSDSFEIISCYLYFLRNNLLLSSSFIFGTVCTICIVLSKSLALLLESSSNATIISSISMLACLLFSWSSFGILVVFFSWTLGYSDPSSSEDSSSSNSNSSNSNSSNSGSKSDSISNSSSKSSSKSSSSSKSDSISNSSSKSDSISDSISSSSNNDSSSKVRPSVSQMFYSSFLSGLSSSSNSESKSSSADSARSDSSTSLSKSSESSSKGPSSSVASVSYTRPSFSSSKSGRTDSEIETLLSEGLHYDELSDVNSEIFRFFPLFTLNIVSSISLCLLTIYGIDYLLSLWAPAYSKSLFLLICCGFSILSIALTLKSSFSLSKSSSRDSSSFAISVFAMVSSICLALTVATASVLEGVSLVSRLLK